MTVEASGHETTRGSYYRYAVQENTVLYVEITSTATGSLEYIAHA